jgi:hypothetical protein
MPYVGGGRHVNQRETSATLAQGGPVHAKGTRPSLRTEMVDHAVKGAQLPGEWGICGGGADR